MNQPIVLLFPGQGSQYVGMAKEFASATQLRLASMTLGYDLPKIMFEGPEEELKLTANTQPALVLHSWLMYEKLNILLESKAQKVAMCLGHSVGEYSALAAAQAITWAHAIKAVHFRGRFMQTAAPVGVGKMIAILKAPAEVIERACKESSRPGSEVSPANYNSPEQIVISGEAQACDRVVALLKSKPEIKFRAIELPVSAPFHCSLMNPAKDNMSKVLSDIPICSNDTDYVANIDARVYPAGTSAEIIKKNLLNQIPGAVRWMQSMAQIPTGSLCIEVGPGKVLAGLMNKIRPELKVFTLDRPEAWDELKGQL